MAEEDFSLCVYTIPRPLNTSTAKNKDHLIMEIHAAESIIPDDNSPIIINNFPFMKPTSVPVDIWSAEKRTLEYPRKKDLADEAAYKYNLISSMVLNSLDELKIPFPSRNSIHWGPYPAHNPVQPKNLAQITDLLVNEANKIAEKENYNILVRVRKLKKWPSEECQRVVQARRDSNVAKNRHALADWDEENSNDVNIMYYRGIIYDLYMRSPKDNRLFGMKSVKAEKLEGGGHDQEPLCSICMKNLEIGKQAIQMPCCESHVFHGHCILEWLDKKPTCPFCRFKLYS